MKMLCMLFALALAACGASETATVAATVGAAKARDVERAGTVPDQVRGKLDEAAKVAEQKREAGEAAR